MTTNVKQLYFKIFQINKQLNCCLLSNTFVPEFRSRPNEANHEPPRRQIVGATATVSTLVTVVGQPNRPISAGNGGLSLGLPCLPSRDSIKAFCKIF